MSLTKKHSRILVLSYSNVEFYPPSLNAITCLAGIADEVTVVQVNVTDSNWDYPANVKLHNVGKPITNEAFMRKNSFQKILFLIQFTWVAFKYLLRSDICVIYDSMALLPFSIAKKFVGTKIVTWYHSHDVHEESALGKFNLMSLAIKNEPKMFGKIDIFTLPAIERLKYFPMEKLKGRFFFLPNFPAKFFYGQFNQLKALNPSSVKLIFQGSLTDGHGFEEIIKWMTEKPEVELLLVGFITEIYKTQLLNLAIEQKVEKRVQLLGRRQYKDLPKLTGTCHIGLAIYAQQSKMKTTLGTAGNKIYEYAACGLPILYFDSVHYRSYLEKYSWALPTDLSKTSLNLVYANIIHNYPELSKKALSDFRSDFFYEKHMKEILDTITIKD